MCLSHIQAQPGCLLLPLECLVPTLERLAAIKYSVFAKGNHCQWHARVIMTLAASLAYFISPCSEKDNNYKQVDIWLLFNIAQRKVTFMLYTGSKNGLHSDPAFCLFATDGRCSGHFTLWLVRLANMAFTALYLFWDSLWTLSGELH